VLVEAVAVGVCGTDREIIAADCGEAPPGADILVLGHESLGRVLEDPTGTRILHRDPWQPENVLVTGAGPIGLLAALLGAQRGLDVHVLDLATDGPKPALTARLRATYHSGGLDGLDFEPDLMLECTGAPPVVFGVMDKVGPCGLVCLTGVSSGGHKVPLDAGALNRALVLENNVVFGSVNANRRHSAAAADALAKADVGCLGDLVTRRVPVTSYADAYTQHDGDIKVVVEFAP
jgi:threonine dehydrogenase-like Zn-dependent dehydrogenase